MIKPFPNIDNMPLPAQSLCPPADIEPALAEMRAGFTELANNLDPGDGVPHLSSATNLQQQQQQ